MTCAPRPASWRQTSNPMPRLPPVTTTIGGCPFAMANQPEWLKTIMRCHRGAVQCLHVSSTILKLPKLLRCRDFPLSANNGPEQVQQDAYPRKLLDHLISAGEHG